MTMIVMCCSRCDRTTSILLRGRRLCEAFRKASPPAEKEGSSESRRLACRKQSLFLMRCGFSHVFSLLFHNEVGIQHRFRPRNGSIPPSNVSGGQ